MYFHRHWDTYPVTLTALLVIVIMLPSAERAADPAVVPTSTIWVEQSGETIVKSRAAGLEQTQFSRCEIACKIHHTYAAALELHVDLASNLFKLCHAVGWKLQNIYLKNR